MKNQLITYFANKTVEQIVTKFTSIFTPNQVRVYLGVFKINAGEKRRMSIFLFSSASFLGCCQRKNKFSTFGVYSQWNKLN